MRDKRRLSRTEAEREKQLGEQVGAKIAHEESQNGGERLTRPPPNLRAMGLTSNPAMVPPPAITQPPNQPSPPMRQVRNNNNTNNINNNQPPAPAIDFRSIPDANGMRSPPMRNSGHPPPAVPPRTVSLTPVSLYRAFKAYK